MIAGSAASSLLLAGAVAACCWCCCCGAAARRRVRQPLVCYGNFNLFPLILIPLSNLTVIEITVPCCAIHHHSMSPSNVMLAITLLLCSFLPLHRLQETRNYHLANMLRRCGKLALLLNLIVHNSHVY